MIIKDWIPHTVGTSRSHTMVWICPRNEQFLEVRWWKLSQNGLHKAYSTSTFQEYIGAYSWNVEIEYDLFKPFIPCLDEYPTLLGRVGTILVEEERMEKDGKYIKLIIYFPSLAVFSSLDIIFNRSKSKKLISDYYSSDDDTGQVDDRCVREFEPVTQDTVWPILLIVH